MNNLSLDVDTRKNTKHTAVDKFRRETSQYLLYDKYDSLTDLETDWDNYNGMNRDDQRESDWRSLEIFRKDNAERYEEMRSEFLKQDIDTSPEIKEYIPRKPIKEEYEEEQFDPFLFIDYNDKHGDYITGIKTEEMLENKGYDILAESVENNLKIDNYYFNRTVVDPIVPFFTPKEMNRLGITQNDRGGLYSDTPDNTMVGAISTKNWINEYRNKYLGFGFENTNWFDWQDTLASLYENYIDILQSGNMSKINNRKQSILDLGWNPELPFDDKTRLYAKERMKKNLDDDYRFKYIDLSDTNGFNMNESADDTRNIYITFLNSRNKAAYYTNEITSYDFKDVGISFDKSLNEIHVFNPLINSFSTLRLPYLNEDTRRCEIYMFKVPANIAATMEAKVKDYNNLSEDVKPPLFGSITVTKNSNIIERPKYVCETFINKIIGIFDKNRMRNGEFIKPDMESPVKGIRIYIGAINGYKPDSYTGSINASNLIKII